MRLIIFFLAALACWAQQLRRGPGIPAAPTHTYTVQTQTAAVTTGNPPANTTCTFSPASQAGDLIFAVGEHTYYLSTITVSDSAGGGSSTYHAAASETASTYGLISGWYAYNVASGITQVTFADSTAGTLGGVCYLIHDSTHSYSSDPLDTTASSHGGSNPYTMPSVTPTQADGVIIASIADRWGSPNSITWTPSASWTSAGAVQAVNSFGLFSQYLLNTSTTAYTPSITYSSSGQSIFQFQAIQFAFKPAQ